MNFHECGFGSKKETDNHVEDFNTDKLLLRRLMIMKLRDRFLFGELLFYLVVLLLPFEEISAFGGMTSSKYVAFLLFAVSLFQYKFYYGSVPSVFRVFSLYVIIGMSIDIISFPFSVESLNDISRPLLMFILMIIAYNLSINNKYHRVLIAVYLSSLIYAFAQAFGLGGDYSKIIDIVHSGAVDIRLLTFGVDANFSACFISLCIIAGIVYGFNFVPTRRLYRILALLTVAIGFFAMLKTASRGGLLALFVGIVSIILTATEWKKRIKYNFLIILLLGIMFQGVLANPLFNDRIRSYIETGDTGGRIDIMERAMALGMDSPIYGYGFRMALLKLGERTGNILRGTHNLFLSVLLGSGLLGLCSFLYFYCRSFITIWLHRADGVNIIIFAWFMMALVASLTLNIENTKWFWIILALALAAGKTMPENGPQNSYQNASNLRS